MCAQLQFAPHRLRRKQSTAGTNMVTSCVLSMAQGTHLEHALRRVRSRQQAPRVAHDLHAQRVRLQRLEHLVEKRGRHHLVHDQPR